METIIKITHPPLVDSFRDVLRAWRLENADFYGDAAEGFQALDWDDVYYYTHLTKPLAELDLPDFAELETGRWLTCRQLLDVRDLRDRNWLGIAILGEDEAYILASGRRHGLGPRWPDLLMRGLPRIRWQDLGPRWPDLMRELPYIYPSHGAVWWYDPDDDMDPYPAGSVLYYDSWSAAPTAPWETGVQPRKELIDRLEQEVLESELAAREKREDFERAREARNA